MSDQLDELGALCWLVEAGADEAAQDAPVNRFQTMAAAPLRAPKNAPSPKPASQFSTPPQGEDLIRVPRGIIRPTAMFNPHAHDNDHIGRALEIANACNTLVELKAAVEAFEGCALKQFANTTVFADGNPAGRIMFIGEAPGYEEDKTGFPFVGRAGKLLDKMLAAIGLDRSSAYIINVLPWRPPDNRNLELTEVAKCIPFLRRHIELQSPQLIVLLGGSPLKHVLGKTEGILQSRGKWLEYHAAGRMVPVMPTLHPAYLLRQPAHKRLAWRDLLGINHKLQQNHGLA